MKTFKLFIFLVLIGILLCSCKKDDKTAPAPDPVKPTPYFVHLTDAPGPYSAVYIQIQSVEIIGGGDTILLFTNQRVYNLLNFSNGLDTLLASGSLTVDKVEQIRLIPGPINAVVKNGITYPLSTTEAQESGLKLKVNHTLQPGVAFNVLLDFDANKSIVDEGNGKYSLKPVIRTIENSSSGSLKGKISQPGVLATVVVSSGSDSYTTVVNTKGEFAISGLPAGSYLITIIPAEPFKTISLENVQVAIGAASDVGTLVI